MEGLLVIGRGKEGLLDLADCENVLRSRKFKYSVLSHEESNNKYCSDASIVSEFLSYLKIPPIPLITTRSCHIQRGWRNGVR